MNLKQFFLGIILILGFSNNVIFASENKLNISDSSILEVEIDSLVRNIFIGGAISSGLMLYLVKETKGFSRLVQNKHEDLNRLGAASYTGALLAGIFGGLFLTGWATKNFRKFIYKQQRL